MKNKFFNDFIVKFYDEIEIELETLMKKKKVKKLSVAELDVDVIDYLGDSKTPIVDTIRLGDEGIELFLKNKEQTPIPYHIEDIFHPFSLAVFADKLLKKDKFVGILENFYLKSEELIANFMKEKNIHSLEVENDCYEVLAISKIDEIYRLIDGFVTDIKLINDRVFLDIKMEDGLALVHIIECSAADLTTLFNEIL